MWRARGSKVTLCSPALVQASHWTISNLAAQAVEEQLYFYLFHCALSAPTAIIIFSLFTVLWRQHSSHHCRGYRGQVSGGAGRGGWFGQAWAWGPNGSVGGHGRGRA